MIHASAEVMYCKPQANQGKTEMAHFANYTVTANPVPGIATTSFAPVSA